MCDPTREKAGEEGIGGRTLDRRVGEVFCRQTLLLEKHLLMQEEGIPAVSIWTKGIPGRQTEQMGSVIGDARRR